MATLKLTKESILQACKYIDEHGYDWHNESTVYELVVEGKKYPPKYVVAVADHIANGSEINTQGFNSIQAKSLLEGMGYMIETKQEKYEITITKGSVVSTDARFTMDDLDAGGNFKPIDAYFVKADGETIHRNRNKGEVRISNQTLPRLACQIFEKDILSLSDDDKRNFPVCQYSPNREVIKGIFASEAEFKKYKNSMEFLTYKRENGPQFIIYSNFP